MKIILNGEAFKISENTNINALLSSHGYKDKTVAVALNGNFIPKLSYEAHIIKANDEIEIVAPMQGG